MNPLPPLTEEERARLRSSVLQDGVIIPVLQDAQGRIIDGHHRRDVAAELGIDCPIQILDVNEETGDRLRITLNWARRQLDTLTAYELIAELAQRHETQAKADAIARMAEGGKGGLQQGVQASSTPSGKVRDVIAERINNDLKSLGVDKRVSGQTVDTARKAAAMSTEEKARVRAGEISASRAVGRQGKGHSTKKNGKPVNNGSTGTHPAKREVPDHVAAQARIRAVDAERKYVSMLNAPEGKLNIPLLDRASKIQGLLLEVTGLTPEQAVSGIPAMRCREYSVEMAKWWLRFAELCDERRRAETPDLPTLYKRPRLASLNPVVVGGPIAPDFMSPATRAVYDWIAKQTEPVTVVEAAVAARINRTTAGDALRRLIQTGHVKMVGSVGSRGGAALHLYQLNQAEGQIDK